VEQIRHDEVGNGVIREEDETGNTAEYRIDDKRLLWLGVFRRMEYHRLLLEGLAPESRRSEELVAELVRGNSCEWCPLAAVNV
jgi:hypothetical protein